MSEASDARRPLLPNRYLPLVILIVLAVLFSVFVRGFFRQVILIPLLSVLLGLYNFYLTVPQNVTWAIFILIALVVAVFTVWTPPGKPDDTPAEEIRLGRLTQLSTLIRDARQSEHARWQLAHEMQTLAIEMLQKQYIAIDSVESLQAYRAAHRLYLPPEIETLFAVCAQLPSYRSFVDARADSPSGSVAAVANLDIEGTVQALARWQGNDLEAG